MYISMYIIKKYGNAEQTMEYIPQEYRFLKDIGSSWLYGHVDALQKTAHFISRAGLQVGQKIGKQECQQHKKT